MKITLYYVICRANVVPYVAFVSKNYEEVVAWRNKLNADAGRDSGICQEWHQISQREVTLH